MAHGTRRLGRGEWEYFIRSLHAEAVRIWPRSSGTSPHGARGVVPLGSGARSRISATSSSVSACGRQASTPATQATASANSSSYLTAAQGSKPAFLSLSLTQRAPGTPDLQGRGASRSAHCAFLALSHPGVEKLLCVSLHPLSPYLEPSLGPYMTPPRGAETSSDLHWRHNRNCGRAGPISPHSPHGSPAG